MEYTHALLLLLFSLLSSRATAQANPISNPPLGVLIKDNLKATLGVMMVSFFSAFVFMGIFSLYIRHCAPGANTNAVPTASDLCGGGFNCNQKVIDTCPVLVYSSVKDLKIGKGAVECAVCLGEFEDSDEIRLLPKCSHVFHIDCIDTWLLHSHMNCPLCRAGVTPDHTSDIVITVTNPTESEQPEPSIYNEHQQLQPQLEEEAREGNIEDGESNSSTVARETETENDVSDVAETVIPPRETRVLDKLPRSFSTGRCQVGPNEAVDRYTLRLPEHVRKRILMNHRRTMRCCLPTSDDVVLPPAWSSKAMYRNERWSLSLTPPLVSNGGGDSSMTARVERTPWTPPRVTFERAHTEQNPSNILPPV